MTTLILALLATLAPAADEPTYTVVVELGNVCGADCVLGLEKVLARIEGVKNAEMFGDKFHFKLSVHENKSVLPSSVRALVEKLKKDSKGEEDFPLESFVATISGTVEKQGDAVQFVARGSGQKYSVKPDATLTALMAAGKSKVTLTGSVAQEKDGKSPPLLQVSEATESSK